CAYRGHHGGEENRRIDPVVPPAGARCGNGRVRFRSGRCPRYGTRLAHQQDRRRDGSDDRDRHRAADDLRHGQGARQRHGRRGSPPAREDGREERHLARGMTPPLPLDEAQRRLLDQVRPLPTAQVAIEAALGRYLAEDLAAARTQPPADLSAMDRYAMRKDDLAGPWRVIGESAAGHPFAGTLNHGEAVRISTGALLPPDAGAILLQENVARDGDTISLNGEGDPTPRHIRRAGLDFRSGDRLLTVGTQIGPAQVALALAGGRAQVSAHQLPRV